MSFERFVKTGKSYRPRISIRANGQFGFTSGAIEKFQLNQYKYAVLFYDKENSKIGIKLTNNEENGILKLQIRASNAFLSAKPFLDYYDIDHNKTKRYDALWDADEEMVVISLR